jgi:hypothetical protein
MWQVRDEKEEAFAESVRQSGLILKVLASFAKAEDKTWSWQGVGPLRLHLC